MDLYDFARRHDVPLIRMTVRPNAALGIVDVPGILQGMDDQDTAPTWRLAAGVCRAGTYLLLPIWATRFARSGLAPAKTA